MKYKHIRDCWNELEECKTQEEIEAKIEEFPRVFGDWYVERVDDSTVEVTNNFYDKSLGQEDSETISFEVYEEDELDNMYHDYSEEELREMGVLII